MYGRQDRKNQNELRWKLLVWECPAISRGQLLEYCRTHLPLFSIPLESRKSSIDGGRKHHAHEALSVQIPFMQTVREAWSIFQSLWSSELLLTCTDSSAACSHDERKALQSHLGNTYHAALPPHPAALTHEAAKGLCHSRYSSIPPEGSDGHLLR